MTTRSIQRPKDGSRTPTMLTLSTDCVGNNLTKPHIKPCIVCHGARDQFFHQVYQCFWVNVASVCCISGTTELHNELAIGEAEFLYQIRLGLWFRNMIRSAVNYISSQIAMPLTDWREILPKDVFYIHSPTNLTSRLRAIKAWDLIFT